MRRSRVRSGEVHRQGRHLGAAETKNTPDNLATPEHVESEAERVGYGHPPKAHRFKPGQSGNPSGKRRGTKSEAEILREILRRKITIRQRHGTRKVTLLEAILLKSADEALQGDLKATVFLLNRLAATQSDEGSALELSADEAEVMKAYAARLLEQAKDQEAA